MKIEVLKQTTKVFFMRTASLILLLAAMAGFARGEDFTYSAFN
ncbi:MAG: hypothetical protein ACI9G1_001586, partial [Pirellulaceae bacterium]